MNKHLRLLIAIPSTDVWSADFGMCLLFLTQRLNHPIQDWSVDEVNICNMKGSIISKSRETMLNKARVEGYTHILFIDSDQTFPDTLVSRLLCHDEDVVACNIATKSDPVCATARTFNNTQYGLTVEPCADKIGLQKVWRVGTGIMLVRLDALENLEQPFFEQYWDKKHGEYVGEDWAFCEKLERNGVAIHIDHELSRQVGHVGSKEYKL